MPAVEGAGHVLQRCARRDGGNTAVAGAVARADVHLPASGFNQHPDDECLPALSSQRIEEAGIGRRHILSSASDRDS